MREDFGRLGRHFKTALDAFSESGPNFARVIVSARAV